MSNGVLSGMMIWRKYDGHRLLEMWQGDYEEDKEDEEDERHSSIPGYDKIIIISSISIVSVMMILRFRNTKKK